MAGAVKKSTIYLSENLHKAIRMKSAETGETVSDIIEEAVAAHLAEDYEDLDSVTKRSKGPFISYEQLLKNLKKDGTI
jgi:predicted DNA-binding protein